MAEGLDWERAKPHLMRIDLGGRADRMSREVEELEYLVNGLFAFAEAPEANAITDAHVHRLLQGIEAAQLDLGARDVHSAVESLADACSAVPATAKSIPTFRSVSLPGGDAASGKSGQKTGDRVEEVANRLENLKQKLRAKRSGQRK